MDIFLQPGFSADDDESRPSLRRQKSILTKVLVPTCVKLPLPLPAGFPRIHVSICIDFVSFLKSSGIQFSKDFFKTNAWKPITLKNLWKIPGSNNIWHRLPLLIIIDFSQHIDLGASSGEKKKRPKFLNYGFLSCIYPVFSSFMQLSEAEHLCLSIFFSV